MVGELSGTRGGLPQERGQLTRAGDGGNAGGLAPLAIQVLPALVQAPLRTPGDLDHARVLALLTASECDPDVRLGAVMVGGLDQQPAGMAGAGLGDRALTALLVGGALGGNDAEEAREQLRRCEAPEVADLRAQAGRGERVDSAETAQTGDHLCVAAGGDRPLEFLDQGASAADDELDRGQVVDEGRLRAGVVERVRTQPRPRA